MIVINSKDEIYHNLYILSIKMHLYIIRGIYCLLFFLYCIIHAETGGSGVNSQRVTGKQGGAEQFVMQVPNNKVGLNSLVSI